MDDFKGVSKIQRMRMRVMAHKAIVDELEAGGSGADLAARVEARIRRENPQMDIALIIMLIKLAMIILPFIVQENAADV